MNDITTIHDFLKFLREHGFIWVTGESCAFSMRILFDMTEFAKDIMIDYLGGNCEFRKGSNWNGSDGQKYSVMIERHSILPLAIFIARKKYLYVVEMFHQNNKEEPYQVICTNHEKDLELIKKTYHDQHMVFHKRKDGGSRNQHQMSGRIQ